VDNLGKNILRKIFFYLSKNIFIEKYFFVLKNIFSVFNKMQYCLDIIDFYLLQDKRKINS